MKEIQFKNGVLRKPYWYLDAFMGFFIFLMPDRFWKVYKTKTGICPFLRFSAGGKAAARVSTAGIRSFPDLKTKTAADGRTREF